MFGRRRRRAIYTPDVRAVEEGQEVCITSVTCQMESSRSELTQNHYQGKQVVV